ncbi:cytidylate kinase family protein [Candidatus Micrarchaeota archaeon]|nr:cytidylate kinase family protein [Candidatus Micrarchaeota archaeon]MBU1165964.1 cytidylate kinase family protein [Candidatus Micrarchaeota archaeon]MBU1886868.1 cytidylate kinase family protein [Candidatus Micrarchaeota archaeon]
MIIAISGLTGSGKNTIGALLSKKLKYKMICPTFKDLAKKEGIDLMEFHMMAKNDHSIDRKFDEMLRQQAKGNCIVTTWLGPWIVDADVRIKVYAPLNIRAERTAKRDGMKIDEATNHILKRDKINKERYMKVYGISIDEDSIFDACLNSGFYTPEELLKIVLVILKTRDKNGSNRRR